MGDSRDGVKHHGGQRRRGQTADEVCRGRAETRRSEKKGAGSGGRGGNERRGPRLGSSRETKRGGIKDGEVDQR